MQIPPVLAFWDAMPPEVNTARLMAGAGPAPMLQAAAGWEAFAILLETQADELAASLATLTSLWSGTAGERAVAATMPMVAWLRVASAQAQQRAAQATAQAEAYSTAMATTPPLAEIELNHVTHAVLEATNFFGINTVPIGFNEADYIRMWVQAVTVMHTYQAATAANVAALVTLMKPKPIVIPGAQGAAMASMGQIAAMAPGSAFREAAFAHVSSQAAVESAALQGGRAAALGNHAATRAEGAVQQADNAAQQGGRQQDKPQQGMQQGMQMGMQMGMQIAGQVGSMVGQIPQQAAQMVQTPMQTLTQPLQQVSSMFSQMGGDKGAQIGLIGTSPFSNHPLAGGSGAGSGAGLVRAASLPGAGGTSPRTPLMANLVGKDTDVAPVAVGAAAGATAGGAAPIGTGGAGPMGMMGQASKSAGAKAGLKAPAPLVQDLGEDDEDEW